MQLNSKNFKKAVLLVFLGALFLTALQNMSVILGIIKKTTSFFAPVIAALCIAFVLNVLLRALETKVFKFMKNSKKSFVIKLQRPLCLAFTYIIAFGIVAALILVIIPDIIDTVTYLAEKMPTFVTEVRDWIIGRFSNFGIDTTDIPALEINWTATAKAVTDWLSGSSGKIVGDAVNVTTSVFSGIFDALFSIVISVYILAQKEKIGNFVKKMLDAFVPKKGTDIIYHISSCTSGSFNRFIGGQLTESLILGTLCFIGMTIFRFPNALIISVFITVTSLVPIVGATVGVIIGFLLIVISNPIKALLFVVFFLVLQQVEGNLIYPKVVGKAVGLPGIIVVSSVLVGGNIGGIFGALISVPVSAVLFTLLKESIEYCNNKKGSELQSEEK